ncbi:HAD superfamily hydrolase (TIGR01509 family) [Kroppenstedtia sanguinis]|uniref:HAD family hydrolase n=1 Tax=Kroppenstedtia sanguinis TaxID=1380684 RepID=UPI003D1E6889
MLRAVIFDFDGLILDTETAGYRTFVEMFEAHGTQLPMDLWSRVIGSSDHHDEIYDHLEATTGQSLDRETLERERWEKKRSLIAREKALPGVRTVLEQAKNLGWKIGLASSSERSWVEGHLEKLGLRHYFSCLCNREDVERTKPDPALYLQAAKCLGVDPAEAVALEDSPNGALAAKRAGMRCIIVPNRVTRDLSFGKVDLRLSSLEELQLGKWAETCQVGEVQR